MVCGEESADGSEGRETEKLGEERQLRKTEARTLLAWNVAGVKNKDKEFWDYVKQFDLVILLETWVEDKEWIKWKGRMPEGYQWETVHAKRIHNKGRAAGGGG